MLCKKCKKEIRLKGLFFANKLSIDKGYCSWACMLADLGEDAWEILRKYIKDSDEEFKKNRKEFEEWKKRRFQEMQEKKNERND